MALSSFTKNFLERLNYISNWKFNFQKTRVIGSLTYIDEALNHFVVDPFFVRPNRGEFFHIESKDIKGTLFHEEAVFLNHIISNWKFDISKLSNFEKEDYLLAVEKLQKWKDLQKFAYDTAKFVDEIKRVISIRRCSEHPPGFYRTHFPAFEFTIIARYHSALAQLEPYPEWREKFRNEIEPHLKLLADHSPEPIDKLDVDIWKGIDLHQYFR